MGGLDGRACNTVTTEGCHTAVWHTAASGGCTHLVEQAGGCSSPQPSLYSTEGLPQPHPAFASPHHPCHPLPVRPTTPCHPIMSGPPASLSWCITSPALGPPPSRLLITALGDKRAASSPEKWLCQMDRLVNLWRGGGAHLPFCWCCGGWRACRMLLLPGTVHHPHQNTLC